MTRWQQYRFQTPGYPMRVGMSATGPLCRCGSKHLEQDAYYRLRCERGHFARSAVRGRP